MSVAWQFRSVDLDCTCRNLIIYQLTEAGSLNLTGTQRAERPRERGREGAVIAAMVGRVGP